MRSNLAALALDPLGPMDIGPRMEHDGPLGPLSLDPLSPIDWVARRIGADEHDPEEAGD